MKRSELKEIVREIVFEVIGETFNKDFLKDSRKRAGTLVTEQSDPDDEDGVGAFLQHQSKPKVNPKINQNIDRVFGGTKLGSILHEVAKTGLSEGATVRPQANPVSTMLSKNKNANMILAGIDPNEQEEIKAPVSRGRQVINEAPVAYNEDLDEPIKAQQSFADSEEDDSTLLAEVFSGSLTDKINIQ